MSTTICYVAGKSGGHIIPALTQAQKVLEQSPQYKIAFFSTSSSLDISLIQPERWISLYIPLTLENIPYGRWHAYPKFLVQLVFAVAQSTYVLLQLKPQKIVSMGGYISLPVCLAARILRIPIELYELNVIPGAANKFLSRHAQTVYTCFKQTPSYLPSVHCQLVDYPLRFKHEHVLSREQAFHMLKLSSNKKILLILGGSQGSHFINELVKNFVVWCTTHNHEIPHIIHQTGERDVEHLKEFYSTHHQAAQVFAYSSDMSVYYSAADLTIARAGAGTLFELAFFKKLAFIIPLEVATTAHQLDNAQALSEQYPKLFTVRRQKDIELDPVKLYDQLYNALRASLT